MTGIIGRAVAERLSARGYGGLGMVIYCGAEFTY